jgi:hypothetical protein
MYYLCSNNMQVYRRSIYPTRAINLGPSPAKRTIIFNDPGEPINSTKLANLICLNLSEQTRQNRTDSRTNQTTCSERTVLTQSRTDLSRQFTDIRYYNRWTKTIFRTDQRTEDRFLGPPNIMFREDSIHTVRTDSKEIS